MAHIDLNINEITALILSLVFTRKEFGGLTEVEEKLLNRLEEMRR